VDSIEEERDVRGFGESYRQGLEAEIRFPLSQRSAVRPAYRGPTRGAELRAERYPRISNSVVIGLLECVSTQLRDQLRDTPVQGTP